MTVYKNSLFDSLGVANKEKIHTQFLNWFFNNEDIETSIKIDFLKALNGDLDIIPTDTKVIAVTEFKSIDLIIVIKNTNSDKFEHVLAFENKLKSTLHSNQLENYNKALGEIEDFKDVKISKFLLSLISEEYVGNGDKWESFSYDELLKIFNKVLSKLTGNNQIFVNEYTHTLNNLLRAKKEFFANPDLFKDVLVVKKSDAIETKQKFNTNEHVAFVAKYQLGTIFMMNFIRVKFADIVESLSLNDYIFKETRGQPLLDIVLFKNDKYILQFQYQNRTTKLQLMSLKSSHDIEENLYENFIKCIPGMINYKKINRAKKGKKNYISTSKILNCKYAQLYDSIKKEYVAIKNNLDDIQAKLNS